MRRILGVVLCLGLVAGLGIGISCYSIPRPECGFACGVGGACPDEYTCNTRDNRCHLNGTSATMVCAIDAAPFPDQPMLDEYLAPPMVTATNPLNGTSNVSRTTTIDVTFDVDVQGVSSSTFIVYTGVIIGPGPIVQLPGIVTYDSPSHTASFTPNPQLPAGTLITPQLTQGISSLQGGVFPGYLFSFSTLDDEAPTLASSAPMDTDVNVPTNSTIVVTFSEPVAGVNLTSFTVAQGVTPIIGTIAAADPIYTFTPDTALPSGQVITVQLAATITDVALNPLVPVQFTFTTQ